MELHGRRPRIPSSKQVQIAVWLLAITVATVVGAYAVLTFTTLPIVVAVAVPVTVGVLFVRHVTGTHAQHPGGY